MSALEGLTEGNPLHIISGNMLPRIPCTSIGAFPLGIVSQPGFLVADLLPG
jgi:hypothetical protein